MSFSFFGITVAVNEVEHIKSFVEFYPFKGEVCLSENFGLWENGDGLTFLEKSVTLTFFSDYFFALQCAYILSKNFEQKFVHLFSFCDHDELFSGYKLLFDVKNFDSKTVLENISYSGVKGATIDDKNVLWVDVKKSNKDEFYKILVDSLGYEGEVKEVFFNSVSGI